MSIVKIFQNKVILKNNQLLTTCLLFFLACPLLGDTFHWDNPKRAWTFCPLMRSVRHFYPLFRGGLFHKAFVLILSGLLTSVRYLEVSANQRFHCIQKRFQGLRKNSVLLPLGISLLCSWRHVQKLCMESWNYNNHEK